MPESGVVGAPAAVSHTRPPVKVSTLSRVDTPGELYLAPSTACFASYDTGLQLVSPNKQSGQQPLKPKSSGNTSGNTCCVLIRSILNWSTGQPCVKPPLP